MKVNCFVFAKFKFKKVKFLIDLDRCLSCFFFKNFAKIFVLHKTYSDKLCYLYYEYCSKTLDNYLKYLSVS